MSGWEGDVQAVEEVPLALGPLRCRRYVLGLLSGLGNRFPLPGRWAPSLVEALRDLQLPLVLGE